MKDTKAYIFIVILNLFFSLSAVYISPRLDVITLVLFIVANGIILSLLFLNEKKRKNIANHKINEIFDLLHSLDIDTNKYEIIDDEFGKLRDEIAKVISENKIVTRKAEENEQVLREYTEDIAHQLKTPLTGMLLMVDLMEEDKENGKEYIKRIRYNIGRLYQLVNILLKFAALDSGTIQMKKEKVNMKDLIEDIITDVEIYFNNDNFKIPVHGKDFIFTCDKRWTYEAIFNIVKNGIEASDDHMVEIYLKETNLFKSVIVEDFSPGLNNKMLQKAYKRFYKENPNSKGYGIGLPMAKSVMEKQNGELLYVKGKSSNTFELRFYK